MHCNPHISQNSGILAEEKNISILLSSHVQLMLPAVSYMKKGSPT
jgi:hypothetical protein